MMDARLIETEDDVRFLIDGKESALLVGTYSRITIVGIFIRGASRECEQGMLKCGMKKDLEWVDLTYVYNDFRVGYETRSLEDPDVCRELVRDVLAQGYSMDEIMNGIERIGIERIKNPRLLTEQQPEWQEQELFVLE